jgi:apolipoprotein N-acyltransferase
LGLTERPDLISAFTQLARAGNTTLVAGSIRFQDNKAHNTLFVFTPIGLTTLYDKHQLVPFAEHFPGQSLLWWLPYVGNLNGNFAIGTGPIVLPTSAGMTIGPLICWESAFGDLAYDEVRSGAQVLTIATDDAWFGTSSGPYQHAQIAQLRAIETGDYVIRAAATGISGVIAPDGTWKSRALLETQTVVQGAVGPPARAPFSYIGPNTVFFALVALYALVLLVPGARRA